MEQLKLRRAMMFMPGNNPAMLQNAGIYGADTVIFDVEDAVAVSEKDAARQLVHNAIKRLQYPCEVAVRINHIQTPFGLDDLKVILPAKPDLIRLPKAETGQDIKIMGLRQGDSIKLTLCCAMVDRYVSSLSEYVDYRSRLQEEATRIAKQCTKRSVEVSINTADCDKECSLFLTVTGTSAEMGDDGSVGRGNRANGLITPHRPMSMEATSGKNPINHIGKIYNLLSSDLAHECVKKVDGLSEIQVRLLSQIGMPIDQPLIASVQIIPESGVTLKDIEKDVYEIIDYGLENITSITERVIKGELKTF